MVRRLAMTWELVFGIRDKLLKRGERLRELIYILFIVAFTNKCDNLAPGLDAVQVLMVWLPLLRNTLSLLVSVG